MCGQGLEETEGWVDPSRAALSMNAFWPLLSAEEQGMEGVVPLLGPMKARSIPELARGSAPLLVKEFEN